jgi:hypothetical protein
MTKPLQGTAFRVMRAELCDLHYEDPPEDEIAQLIHSPRTVSWKSVVVTPFKTLQECVGQNGNQHVFRGTNRQTERSFGVVRLVALTWQVGVAKKGELRQ